MIDFGSGFEPSILGSPYACEHGVLGEEGPHASEAVVPLERGVRTTVRIFGGRPDPVAWPGVSMAERSVPGRGGRRVERVPAAVISREAWSWRQGACGTGGGVLRSVPVCSPRRRCEENKT